MKKQKKRRTYPTTSSKQQGKQQLPLQSPAVIGTPQLLFEQGEFEAASLELKDFLQHAPTDTDSLRLLAQCYFKLHQYHDAVAAWQQLSTPHWQDLLMTGKAFLHLRQWEQAIGALEASLQEHKTSQTYYFLYEAYCSTRHLISRAPHEASPRELEQFILNEQTAHLDLLHQAKTFDDCPVEVYLALKEYQWSKAVFQMDGCTPEKQEELRRSGHESCLQIIEEAALRYPDQLRLVKERIRTLISLGQHAMALQTLSSPMLRASSDPELIAAAVQCHLSLKHYEMALEYLDRLPNKDEFYLLRGDLSLLLNQISQAHASYLQASQSNQFDIHLFGLLCTAWTWYLQGEEKSAEVYAQRAVDTWFEHADTFERVHFPSLIIMVGEILLGCPVCSTCAEEICNWLLHSSRSLSKKLQGQLRYLLCRFPNAEWNEEKNRERYEHLLFQAYQDYPHPHMSNDLHHIYLQRNDLPKAVEHLLLYAAFLLISFPHDYIPSYAELSYREEYIHLSREERQVIHQIALSQLQGNISEHVVSEVFRPFYASFWRSLLYTGECWQELTEVTSPLLHSLPDDLLILLDAASGAHRADQFQPAEISYRRFLDLCPDDAVVLHLFALLLYSQDRNREALPYANQAVKLDPENELLLSTQRDIVQSLQTKPSPKPTKQDHNPSRAENAIRSNDVACPYNPPGKREKRQPNSLISAQSWHQLDRYKRQILSALSNLGYVRDWASLAPVTGIDIPYLKRHWQKLVAYEMILENETGFFVHPSLDELARLEYSHAIRTTLITPRTTAPHVKPIFNSQNEYKIYSILLEIFPHHLVFPNMALVAMFENEHMKEVLSSESFGYFLRASVDFCILSTTTYLPLLAIEVDSVYHDGKQQQERDEKKDQIFALGGVPLLRIRPYGHPTLASLRSQMNECIRQMTENLVFPASSTQFQR